MADASFRLLARRTLHRGHILHLTCETVSLPHDGDRQIDMDVVRHPGAAAVVALDDDGRVLLVRQWRQPVARRLLGLPAGCIEAGEPPQVAAQRELQEETGATAQHWQPLGELWPSPGFSDEKVSLFVARGLRFGPSNPDANEHIELVRMPFAQALQEVTAGRLCDAKTVCGLLRAQAGSSAGVSDDLFRAPAQAQNVTSP